MADATELRYVTAEGRPESWCIANVETARAVFDDLVEGGKMASIRHGRIRRIKDGNPPYNEGDIKARNLGYMHNINDNTMKAILDQKAGYHFELFQEVPNLAEFKLARGLPAEAASAQPRERWEDVVAEEFTATLRRWPGFLPLMDFVRRESDAFDIGICTWPDPLDWRPIPIPRDAFLPEPYARLDVDTWDLFGYIDIMRVHQLLEIAENPDDAASEGWDHEAVKSLLIKLYHDGLGQTAGPGGAGYAHAQEWDRVLVGVKNNDSWAMSRMFDPVRVRKLAVREPKSGKISILAFPDEVQGLDRDAFLQVQRDRYDKMSHVVWTLPYNYGDGYIRSVRGLATILEAHCDLSNRTVGMILDAAKLNASLMVKPTSAGVDPRRLNIVRTGVMTFIPNSLDVQPTNNFNPSFEGLLRVRQLSDAIMRNNSGVWRQHTEGLTENQPAMTAREVAERSTKEARLEKANVAFDYVQLELLYKEIFRRLTNPELRRAKEHPGSEGAQEFFRRCRERGVQAKYLNPRSLELKIVQAIGMGSWGVRLDVTSQLMQMRGLFDEAGRVNAIRDRVSALVGQQNVDRYKAVGSRDQIASNEHSIASLENAAMSDGKMVMAGSDQRHQLHFRFVAEFLGNTLKEVSQQQAETGAVQNPGRYRAALEAGVQHAMQHLQYLGQDDANEALVAEGVKVLRAAQAMIDFLMKAEQVQAEAEAKRQQEDQLLVAEAEGMVLDRKARMAEAEKMIRLQMEQDKQASIVSMRQQKAAESSEAQRRRLENELALRAEEQSRKLALAEEEARAKIDRLRRLAEAREGTNR